MKLAWTTDPHLNFVDDANIDRFAAEIRSSQVDALLIGGDIGEADSFAGYLHRLADAVEIPIHFVLGNHDYYKGSVSSVRQTARQIGQQSGLLTWLGESDPIVLTDKTALIGHGGWGDARAADFLKSDVILNDYLLIEELRAANGNGVPSPEGILTPNLMAALQRLGDEAADHFRSVLPSALERCERALVLMHVPPFREACWHDGQLSDDNWAPHFTCLAAGDALLDIAKEYPQKQLTVLCGHTHSAGVAQIHDNLEVITGDAVYGQPKVQRVFELH